MLKLAIIFLVLAVVAGFVGYGGVADYTWAGAKTFFFVFLVLALMAFVSGRGFFSSSR
jgi:uncharacterized membrane protein YtjA (UPF0391 family)